MAVVETRNLTKRFHDHTAVAGVSLACREGEFLVLLGPSGCGKTTLLRMIAGLEEPTSGEVYIGGELMNGLPPRARKIAMVFQSYALYPHMTVARNIAFPLRAERVDPKVQAEKVQWAADLLHITRHLNRRPRHLSGGERQRVALARALVREPNVFLLDEPLSNLDAKLRTLARDELIDFQRKVGITTIYVTHDQVEAMGMGDRIAVMAAGVIRQLGTPKDVYDDPADTFVATFIGSPPMNLLDRGDHLVGFRPESFHPAVPGDEVFKFDIHRVEYLGSDRFLYGAINGSGDATRVISRIPISMNVDIQIGERPFGVPPAALRFFDKETGVRMPTP